MAHMAQEENGAVDYRLLAEQLIGQHGNRGYWRDMRTMDRSVAGEQYVLNYLFDHDGTAHPKDVRCSMEVTSSRIAAILRALERGGFVVRVVDPGDRRQAIVTLTDKGRARVVERRAAAIERCVWFLQQLGPEDACALVRLQRRVGEILRESHGGRSRDVVLGDCVHERGAGLSAGVFDRDDTPEDATIPNEDLSRRDATDGRRA